MEPARLLWRNGGELDFTLTLVDTIHRTKRVNFLALLLNRLRRLASILPRELWDFVGMRMRI